MHASLLQFPAFRSARIGLLLGLSLTVAAAADRLLPLGARLAVCFPPAAPVFGDAIPGGSETLRQGQFIWSPPAPLADYVSETFYPPLSTRLIARSLSARLEARLDAYRMQRSTLINELADQVLTLQGADAATREAEWRAFAERQNPRIIALEREADELRRALIDGGLLQLSVDWSHNRHWRIGAAPFASEQAEREAEFQVVRAAAYYENGFTIEQRGLLLELAAELQVRARELRSARPPGHDDPAAMFFSPAMSRLRLPKNAPPELIAGLGRFNRAKSELKRDLRAAVFEQDRAGPEERAAAFEALAERQWPQLVELDQLADKIRVELAAMPPAPLQAGPQLPAALSQQIEAYERDRQAFIGEFEQTLREAMDQHRAKLSIRPSNERERRELARLLAEDRISLRAKVAQAFETESRERHEDLRRRHDQIQEQLKVVAAGKFDSATGQPFTAETLLLGHAAAEQRFDAYGREEVIYRGYRLAMLMPGLSPEQRRLLFGFALVGLAQPLPAGEPLPYESQPTPRS